ncbi:MAG: PAS domain-containing protein [Crocinitomicaceae bacterium]|nr:PAS domain-containing protein [Crocinitomicaceae bacterium]MBK8927658.1 PAS domain-containing protein [Crocinitomicaceae bacterium]
MTKSPLYNTDGSFKDHLYFTLAQALHQLVIVLEPVEYRMLFLNHYQPGYHEGNVLGHTIFEFVAPEYNELYAQKLAEAKQTKKIATIQIVGQSSENSSGKAWYETKIVPVENAEGEITHLFLVSEDISILKQRELELANAAEKVKSIINNTTDIICSIDTNFNLIEFNHVFAQMVHLAVNKEPSAGDPVLEVIDPIRHEKLKEIYHKVLQGERLTDVEVFHSATMGNMSYESNYHPIYNHDGKIIGINIFSKNITEKVKQQHDLENALKEKEILLAEIHHRIKNNLALVSSMLELQELESDNPELSMALSASRKRIKSTALVHELLYASDSFKTISLSDYLVKLFEFVRPDETHQLNIAGDDSKLQINQAMPLGLMLNEIMTNSAKHVLTKMQHTKTVIELQQHGTKLQITYRDHAGTFPEQVSFEISESTGLTLIRTFAEQMDGEIKLISKTPVVYFIEIPLHA